MKKILQRVKLNPYWKLLYYLPIHLAAFALIERITQGRVCWATDLPLDQMIPFCEWFVFFYLIWFPFMILPGIYWLLNEPETFRRYMLSVILGFSISMAVCFVFPNYQPLRPDPVPRQNIASALVRFLYAIDTNENVFPSMHVVGAALVVFACRYSPAARCKPFLLPVCAVLSVLIMLSTLMIKQHAVLDVVAALALCVPLYAAIYGKRCFRALRLH